MPEVRYEIAIFNQSVRESLARGEQHRHLSEDWSEIRYVELSADSLEELHDRIEQRFPARQGFVVEALSKID